MKQISYIIVASTMIAGCLPLKNSQQSNGALKGYDAQQLDEFQRSRGVTLVPQYSRLSEKVGERQKIRMAIFIAYDRLIADDAEKLAAANAKAEGEYDPWSDVPTFAPVINDSNDSDLKNAGKDYGAASFAEVLRWLVDGEHSMLKEATFKKVLQGPTTFSAEIRGKGPSLAQSSASSDWEILLYLGVAGTPEYATAFGQAMAVSHIAMMNGHFFQEDAKAAEKAAAGEATKDRFRDWSADDERLDQFWNRHESNVYKPAMEAFRAAALSIPVENRLGYRVVVFNGCGSERIEDLVLNTMSRIPALDANRQPSVSEVELVGMRGFSNYRHFPSQIYRLIGNLVNGAKWKEVISSFEFNDESTKEAMIEYLGRSTPGNSAPVFRSAAVGADGAERAKAKQADLEDQADQR